MDGLSLTRQHWLTMQAHVEAQAPLEACGLLAGRDGCVRAVLPVTNQARSATHFTMDPVEQLRAFEWIDEHGMQLLGIFHSHPDGPRGPSPTDIAEAAYEVVQVIWSLPHGAWEPRAYLLAAGHAYEVQLEIIANE